MPKARAQPETNHLPALPRYSPGHSSSPRPNPAVPRYKSGEQKLVAPGRFCLVRTAAAGVPEPPWQRRAVPARSLPQLAAGRARAMPPAPTQPSDPAAPGHSLPALSASTACGVALAAPFSRRRSRETQQCFREGRMLFCSALGRDSPGSVLLCSRLHVVTSQGPGEGFEGERCPSGQHSSLPKLRGGC